MEVRVYKQVGDETYHTYKNLKYVGNNFNAKYMRIKFGKRNVCLTIRYDSFAYAEIIDNGKITTIKGLLK